MAEAQMWGTHPHIGKGAHFKRELSMRWAVNWKSFLPPLKELAFFFGQTLQYVDLNSLVNWSEVKWSKAAQLCLPLCDPIGCSLPGSSVHGIFQAWLLEWVAISFSRGSSRPRDQTQVSRIVADALPSELPGKPLNSPTRGQTHTICSGRMKS